MAFSDQFLEELEEKNPIEDVVGSYVNLTRRGSRRRGSTTASAVTRAAAP